MNTYGLGGKVALVTGGASGIGRACAHTLARSGADVAIWDRDEEGISRVLGELEAYGYRTHGTAVDVGDPDQVDDAMSVLVRALGHLDVAVCNAGIGGAAATSADYTDEDWHAVTRINLDGVFYTQRAALRAIKAAGRGGSIINMSSILGSVGFATAGAYTASKHGVVGLTQVAAWEHAADGIRVNAVGPAFIRTPLLDQLDESMQQQLAAQHALQRLGEPEEVAELVAWLASDGASFATGTYYPIDGGYLAR